MVYPDLVAYIQDQTQQGMGADLLRETLMEAGWRELDIDNALHDVAAGLHPVTAGASLHEDLAQVRGMVAHLAGRVRILEAHLAEAPTMPMQAELPSGTIGPERELMPARHHSSWLRHGVAVLFGVMVFLALRGYAAALVARNAMAPTDQFVVALAIGLVLLIAAFVAMRMHWVWPASLATDAAVALMGLTAWIAYHTYHSMEKSTFIGIAVLLVVIFGVMERWSDRLAR